MSYPISIHAQIPFSTNDNCSQEDVQLILFIAIHFYRPFLHINFIITIPKLREMNTQTLQTFFAGLQQLSSQKNTDWQESQQKSGKQSLSKFALHLASNLEMEESTAFIALITAKRAVDHNLKFSKKAMRKLITTCFLIAEKLFEEEHHTLESYSLISGIPMREIALLESRILLAVDYQVWVNEEDVLKLKLGNIDDLFPFRVRQLREERRPQ